MYHYNPETALDELKDDAKLPHPVHVRDMIIRTELKPEQAMELNRKFQEYLHAFGEAQKKAGVILEELVGLVRE
jgi:predicted metal-binding transcription factor (methanogenesis marker protein 9)